MMTEVGVRGRICLALALASVLSACTAFVTTILGSFFPSFLARDPIIGRVFVREEVVAVAYVNAAAWYCILLIGVWVLRWRRKISCHWRGVILATVVSICGLVVMTVYYWPLRNALGSQVDTFLVLEGIKLLLIGLPFIVPALRFRISGFVWSNVCPLPCPSCGYHLRGSVSAAISACPECGTSLAQRLTCRCT